MDENPYQSPQAPREHTSRWLATLQRMAYSARRFPFTIVGIAFASAVSALYIAREYAEQVQLAREGALLTQPSLLDTLSIPGIFCAYVVVNLTGSGAIACIAGLLGMATSYGVPGFLLDLFRRQFTENGSATKSGSSG